MNTVELIGGLGNQLFQIFALLGYCIKHNKSFCFEDTDYSYDRYTYWDSFLSHLRPYLITDTSQFIVYKEKSYEYNEIENLPYNIKLHGYFQTEKYFKNEYEKIIKILKIEDIKENIKSKYNTNFDIAIHFRLGDYKYIQHKHPVLPISYYVNSLNHIIKTTGRENYNAIYFCENEDINTVNENIKILSKMFPSINFTKFPTQSTDWEQLFMMSLCEHNIIANSSFSWWGAYFNNNKDKIVCYPSIWFGIYKTRNIKDLIPDAWKKINI